MREREGSFLDMRAADCSVAVLLGTWFLEEVPLTLREFL